MENTVPAILSILFGSSCVIASRWIAQCAARHQSRFLSVLCRREIRLSPEHYRIPFILAGIAFVAIGILAAFGMINFKA
jgi:hypothetical protein